MAKNLLKITVLVSGTGTGLQAIIDACNSGVIENAKVTHVMSDNASSYALERAKNNGIYTTIITNKDYLDDRDREDAWRRAINVEPTDLIICAGFLTIIPTKLVEEYSGRLINIHPSLLPKYGGKGFYGIKVHEAVIAAGDIESGATVHYVDDSVDCGEIIEQLKVPVYKKDTPDNLQERVKVAEHRLLPMAINKWRQQKGI